MLKKSKMRVFAVSGYSGTGKTTLVEKIVRSLVESGHSVATIKSSKHEAGPDQDSDTWRHKQAGASLTFFLGPSTESTDFVERIGPDNLAELTPFDFLIVEGMKSANIPKFWCIGDKELADTPVKTEAIVSWSDNQVDSSLELPVFIADEIEKLVEIVKTKAVDISEIK
jgi:molybdopterin-guanine dinucleotide biosynthesis protein B